MNHITTGIISLLNLILGSYRISQGDKKEIAICDSCDHEDIVYTGKECPLCEALERTKELEEELERLTRQR